MVVWKTTFVRGRDNLFWNGKQILSFFRTTFLTFETPLSYSKTQFLNKKKLSCFCEVFKRQIYYPKIRQRKTRSVFSVFSVFSLFSKRRQKCKSHRFKTALRHVKIILLHFPYKTYSVLNCNLCFFTGTWLN